MADQTTVHIGENSREEVAYKLLKDVGRLEGMHNGIKFENTDRKWLLDTYAQCLTAVKGNR